MPSVRLNQNAALRGMAAATLLGMPLIAWVIARFSDNINLMERWTGPMELWKQVLFGLPAGLLAGLAAKGVIALPFMKEERLRYSRMLGSFKLNLSEILFISMCAGVGEELLFRGVLQVHFGIVLTALIFVAIHGYLNPKNWRISIYGAFMTAVVIGFGVMTEWIGIWSAVVAHFLVDVLLFSDLRKREPKATGTKEALGQTEVPDGQGHNEGSD